MVQVGVDRPERDGCAGVDNGTQNTSLLRKDRLVDRTFCRSTGLCCHGDYWSPAPPPLLLSSTTSQLPGPVHLITPLTFYPTVPLAELLNSAPLATLSPRFCPSKTCPGQTLLLWEASCQHAECLHVMSISFPPNLQQLPMIMEFDPTPYYDIQGPL